MCNTTQGDSQKSLEVEVYVPELVMCNIDDMNTYISSCKCL